MIKTEKNDRRISLCYAVNKLVIASSLIFLCSSCSLLLLDVIFYQFGFGYSFANLYTFNYWSVAFYPLIINNCNDIEKDCYMYSSLFVFFIYQLGVLSIMLSDKAKFISIIKVVWYWTIAFGLFGLGILRFIYEFIASDLIGYNNHYYAQCFWMGSVIGVFLVISSLWLGFQIVYCRKAMAVMTSALIFLAIAFIGIDDISSPFTVESAYLQLLILLSVWHILSAYLPKTPPT